MDRRSFLSWVGIGWVASCLPIAIAACTSNNDAETSAVASPSSRADGYKAVGKVADLGQKNYLLVQGFAGGPVLVTRNPKKPREVSAVNPTCTHRGCTVEWKDKQSTLVCPCHGATFSPDGKVVKGPASQPLKKLAAKVEGDTVFVKA